ncbi:MAG: hemerythrin domain-containing protein [Chloroflexi bacterium]|nr:hemerythrin domain-containing protein [Chloroflexota bacterium]
MTMSKSCPGSRAVREPTPEYINCPNCGEEVEIWTHELSRACSKCGTRVFREQRPSCIDWCPYAEQCIGPQVYASLKAPKAASEAGGALALLQQEHEEATEQLNMLRAGALCLRIGASAAQVSQTLDQGLSKLAKALEFFDGALKLHFQHEEEDIFPLLDKRIGTQGSPTQVLLAEHAELWQWHGRLKEKLAALEEANNGNKATIANEINDIVGHIESLLRGHIEKEDTSLLALAGGLLREEELQAITEKWRSAGPQAA